MAKVIVPMDMPHDCGECPFRTPSKYIHVGDGLYKMISRCAFADTEVIEDPWRDVWWQYDHKEEWCPLKEMEE